MKSIDLNEVGSRYAIDVLIQSSRNYLRECYIQTEISKSESVREKYYNEIERVGRALKTLDPEDAVSISPEFNSEIEWLPLLGSLYVRDYGRLLDPIMELMPVVRKNGEVVVPIKRLPERLREESI